MPLTRDTVFWSAFSSLTSKTEAAAQCLRDMMNDPQQVSALAKRVKDIEHEGDKITHEVVQALHQTWITPLDREEIHSLITSLDDVLDFIDAASDRFALYEIGVVRPEAVELADTLQIAVRDIGKAVDGLKRIKDPAPLLELCRAINKHEHDADMIYRKAIARLFKENSDPLLVMKWREVFEAMETATDRAEDVANIIEGIILEHA
jgi:predicted phosphate transport protein (TIGR00153 family)